MNVQYIFLSFLNLKIYIKVQIKIKKLILNKLFYNVHSQLITIFIKVFAKPINCKKIFISKDMIIILL